MRPMPHTIKIEVTWNAAYNLYRSCTAWYCQKLHSSYWWQIFLVESNYLYEALHMPVLIYVPMWRVLRTWHWAIPQLFHLCVNPVTATIGKGNADSVFLRLSFKFTCICDGLNCLNLNHCNAANSMTSRVATNGTHNIAVCSFLVMPQSWYVIKN